MENKSVSKVLDPIPDEFASLAAAAEFWDTHDTTDYPDAFLDVQFDVDLQGRVFDVPVDEDVLPLLQQECRRRRISVRRLASELLRRELQRSAVQTSGR